MGVRKALSYFILCSGGQWCVVHAWDLKVCEGTGRTGSEAAPCTAPAIFCDFQSIRSVGSFRETIGFAGGWGGFNTAQLNLPNSKHVGSLHLPTETENNQWTKEYLRA